MRRGVFVTGTDTDVGKTVVSGLISFGMNQRTEAGYFKPVQTGELLDRTQIGDWLGLDFAQAASVYQLPDPMSPDRAAEKVGENIALAKIKQAWSELAERFWIVEGAGGIQVPLNEQARMIDLIAQLQLPTVVVARTQLGTINHTLLTWQSLVQRGIQPSALFLVGDEDPGLDRCLASQIEIPHLIEIPQWPQVHPDRFADEWANNQALQNWAAEILSEKPVTTDVQALDKQYVWHPFTQHKTCGPMREVLAGKGSYLIDHEGRKIFDAISSWWVNLHGHSHPQMARAIAAQAELLEHVIFAGFTHQPATVLCQRLVELCQQRGCSVQRGFFSDNGSTSVEVALKIAFQYHQNLGDQKRTRFLGLKGSYHGDTLGAMSVAERGSFHQVFEPLMFPVDEVSPGNLQQLEEQFQRYGNEYAAVIVEPLVQGAGGMRMYGAEFLNRLEELANQYGVLKIADEVFTGFYRTGHFFAFEHSAFRPDLLCLSKGLTGGFLPMSLTLARESLFNAFADDSLRKAFLHGHSYTANPIACRAALTSLDLLLSVETQTAITELSAETSRQVHKLNEKFSEVHSPRTLGTIGAWEFAGDSDYFANEYANAIRDKAYERGILLRPLGTTLYTLPPYSTTPAQLAWVYENIREILTECLED